jgi:hypothetical protein
MNLDFVGKKIQYFFFLCVCVEEPWLYWESFIKKMIYYYF